VPRDLSSIADWLDAWSRRNCRLGSGSKLEVAFGPALKAFPNGRSRKRPLSEEADELNPE
jgi:hypothetical protein